MSEQKDAWDKFDILFKSLVLGAIPIVIGFAADNVAQSLQRGQLIQSLVESLSKADSRRDIALIALDESIPPRRECQIFRKWICTNDVAGDPVVKIAAVLINQSIDTALKEKQAPEDLIIAREIISGTERGDVRYYRENFGGRIENLKKNAQTRARSNLNPDVQPSNQEIEEQSNISQTLAAIQPSSEETTTKSLEDIRLVYIQYESNRALAEELQVMLQSGGVSAPGIEQVSGIEQNDIRYASAADRQAAEDLRTYLQNGSVVQFSDLVDFSNAGYRVSQGQFEVWIE